MSHYFYSTVTFPPVPIFSALIGIFMALMLMFAPLLSGRLVIVALLDATASGFIRFACVLRAFAEWLQLGPKTVLASYKAKMSHHCPDRGGSRIVYDPRHELDMESVPSRSSNGFKRSA